MGSGGKPRILQVGEAARAYKGFDYDVNKAEQVFDLLLKEKQLKLSEGHKFPTAQEQLGRPYCKCHNSFTDTTNDCKELRRQIQSAIEQGRLILGQFTMKVDSQPFLVVNMVECDGISHVVFVWRTTSLFCGVEDSPHNISVDCCRTVASRGQGQRLCAAVYSVVCSAAPRAINMSHQPF
jgi:hypothetical protein